MTSRKLESTHGIRGFFRKVKLFQNIETFYETMILSDNMKKSFCFGKTRLIDNFSYEVQE